MTDRATRSSASRRGRSTPAPPPPPARLPLRAAASARGDGVLQRPDHRASRGVVAVRPGLQDGISATPSEGIRSGDRALGRERALLQHRRHGPRRAVRRLRHGGRPRWPGSAAAPPISLRAAAPTCSGMAATRRSRASPTPFPRGEGPHVCMSARQHASRPPTPSASPRCGGLRRDAWQPAEPARRTPRCPSTALQRNRPGGGRSGEQGEGTGAADAPEPEDEVDRTRAPAPSAGSSSPRRIPGPAPQTRWSWRTSLSTGQARHRGRRPSGRCPQTPPGRRKRAPSSSSSGGASSAATSSPSNLADSQG